MNFVDVYYSCNKNMEGIGMFGTRPFDTHTIVYANNRLVSCVGCSAC